MLARRALQGASSPRSIEILELGDDKRNAHALDATNGCVDLPGCPGLTLDLDALWSEVDALAQPGV